MTFVHLGEHSPNVVRNVDSGEAMTMSRPTTATLGTEQPMRHDDWMASASGGKLHGGILVLLGLWAIWNF